MFVCWRQLSNVLYLLRCFDLAVSSFSVGYFVFSSCDFSVILLLCCLCLLLMVCSRLYFLLLYFPCFYSIFFVFFLYLWCSHEQICRAGKTRPSGRFTSTVMLTSLTAFTTPCWILMWNTKIWLANNQFRINGHMVYTPKWWKISGKFYISNFLSDVNNLHHVWYIIG